MKRVSRVLRDRDGVEPLASYLRHHFDTRKFPVRVILERYVAPRSLSQNGLMHLWFEVIAEQVGDSPASVKESLKAMFLPEVEGINGVMRRKGTRELTTPEASDFLTQIQALAVEMEWELPQT